jgi:hypothetical protein
VLAEYLDRRWIDLAGRQYLLAHRPGLMRSRPAA